ncbi:hypothetical protein [Streptomyces sulfonofaciens]|uniref:hypothetical protein n=1 Tax=Streptomyces sulfonofaciens TaxID=68272 RepID=UPI001E2AD225|nr:hypothetical protein [Streptomyces sulfonofaciens]
MDRLPRPVRDFAGHLAALLSRLDQGAGWCGVFWQRDPEGMRACLDGREVPPWDVVEALLQDLAAREGAAYAAQETARTRVLHDASLAAHDALPGARDRLGDRLAVMLREQRYAAERGAELDRRLRGAPPGQAGALRQELAWAHDDHARATARCAELRARMAELDRRTWREAQGHPAPHPEWDGRTDPDPHPEWGRRTDPAQHHDPDHTAHPGAAAVHEGAPAAVHEGAPAPLHGAASAAVHEAAPAAPHESAPAPRKRPRGARFAGSPGGVDDTGRPARVPLAAPPAGGPPRGARFAGSPPAAGRAPARRPAPEDEDEAHREVAETVAALQRLRAEGRGGEAHVVLVEAATWPVERFPPLAGELTRAGLAADWSTLLWEAAALPTGRLVALADTLTAHGRADDGGRLLRQAAARPASDVGATVLALLDGGRTREARALLDACVRSRSPEDAAHCARSGPERLVPLLTEAAEAVSGACHRDLRHALRVAGLSR